MQSDHNPRRPSHVRRSSSFGMGTQDMVEYLANSPNGSSNSGPAVPGHPAVDRLLACAKTGLFHITIGFRARRTFYVPTATLRDIYAFWPHRATLR